jgi:hemerythrin
MTGSKFVRPLSPLGWIPAFAVGEELLDQQHRKLMRDLNELTDLLFESSSWSSVVKKCEELREDSIEHFKTEEEVLNRTAYPQFAQHRSVHRQLEWQLDDIVGHLVRVPHASRTDIEGALYLRSMLIDHFFRKDFAYKSHILKSREQRLSGQLDRGARESPR